MTHVLREHTGDHYLIQSFLLGWQLLLFYKINKMFKTPYCFLFCFKNGKLVIYFNKNSICSFLFLNKKSLFAFQKTKWNLFDEPRCSQYCYDNDRFNLQPVEQKKNTNNVPVRKRDQITEKNGKIPLSLTKNSSLTT